LQIRLHFLTPTNLALLAKLVQVQSFVGILDSPMEQLAGGMALTREYLLYAKTSDVSATVRGTAITVGGASYTVRQNLPIDDGLFSELLLSKV
jgi:hypothetical protein